MTQKQQEVDNINAVSKKINIYETLNNRHGILNE